MKKKIIQLVADCAPYVELPEIDEGTQILDELDYDSLSIITLFEEIEREFGVNCMLYSDVSIALTSVGSLIDFVEKRMKEKEL